MPRQSSPSAQQQAMMDMVRKRAGAPGSVQWNTAQSSGRMGLPTPGGSPPMGTGAAQAVPQAYNDRVQPGANPGLAQQQVGKPLPGNAQMSPQAQAMIDEMRRRQGLLPGQRMAEDQGVFAGQQQGASMPGLPNGGVLPSLFG